MRYSQLPYQPDSAPLFARLVSEPWSAFLDSGPPQARRGRYDIIAARPHATLVSQTGTTRINSSGDLSASIEDPFQLIRSTMGAALPVSHLPFIGGALGYWAYDLSHDLAGVASPGTQPMHPTPDPAAMPAMALGLYDWALVVDHLERQSWLASALRHPTTTLIWDDLCDLFSQTDPASESGPSPTPFQALSPARSNFTRSTYQQAFLRIQDYIRNGDCYQVNLAQRFSFDYTGDPWSAYLTLRQRNPAPHGAFLHLPQGCILSSSPERFLEVRGDTVHTTPIKGTRPRHPDPVRDAALARELAHSAKDRAENLMIVDLLRNDLGKVCRPGSIQVPALFQVEHYANVHHLVSTVTGRLAPGMDALAALRAAFPGGSITGAPKRRAMEIIAELEPDPRQVYCGSIGYLSHDGGLDTNIAIRTLLCQRGQAHFWAGGGIVADSQADAEWQECLDKAAPMIALARQP